MICQLRIPPLKVSFTALPENSRRHLRGVMGWYCDGLLTFHMTVSGLRRFTIYIFICSGRKAAILVDILSTDYHESWYGLKCLYFKKLYYTASRLFFEYSDSWSVCSLIFIWCSYYLEQQPFHPVYFPFCSKFQAQSTIGPLVCTLIIFILD